MLKRAIMLNDNVINRETGEVMQEHDTLMWERNISNATLENENSETNLNARRIFSKGALNSAAKRTTKHDYYSQRTIKINRDHMIKLYLQCSKDENWKHVVKFREKT